jgi:RNA polymerase sigma-70 factor (ECF subfamily)
MTETEQLVERVARQSYGRLLAYLTSRFHDWAASEDALAVAFSSALEAWPRTGVPDEPEAWLLVVARRRLMDEEKRTRVQSDAEAVIREAMSGAERAVKCGIPDERLEMLFLCAHPAINPTLHTPLMLQAVLGLNAERIASAFLVRPSTMGQRLSRAKAKIRNAKLRFELPDQSQLPERLGAVLEAIYAAYGAGWDDLPGFDKRGRGLADEAIYLGRLITDLLPDEPEAHGLLALMLFCESRRLARRSADGEYIPLGVQSIVLWSKEMIVDAERHLWFASTANSIGRFQLEAAIQSVHACRAVTGFTDWDAIALLYQALVQLAPTVGCRVSHAAAVAEARGAQAGWQLIASLSLAEVRTYQPYWALAGHLHRLLGRKQEAVNVFQAAIGLCEDGSVRRFLARQGLTL